MKTIFRSILAVLATLFIASCSDVPAPYNMPEQGEENDGGSTETPAGKTLPYSETFENGLGDFKVLEDKNQLPSGLSYVWTKASYLGGCAKGSAYIGSSKTDYAAESWLASPEIDLTSVSAPVTLSFAHVCSFFKDVETMKQQATLWVKAESDADWKQLTIDKYSSNTSYEDSVRANVDLSTYAGKKIQFAFKYTSTEEKAGTWEITKLSVYQGKPVTTPDPGEDTPAPTTTPGTLTKAADLTEGTYAFGYFDGKAYKLMKNLTKKTNYVDYTDWTTGSVPADCQFTLAKSGDGWTIKGDDGKYVYAEEATKNSKPNLYLKVGGESAAGVWTFTDDTNGIKAQFADYTDKNIVFVTNKNFNEFSMGFPGSGYFYPTLYKLK